MILPDIPRLYTALAEILGAVLYAQAAPSRTAKPVYWGITAGCGALLAAFLYLTGDVPLLWWIPCMAAALHSELAAMDNVLHRQYEQYKQSKENIRLTNRRYHELKMQIAAIRAERDKVKQDAALAEMEGDIHRYEAENKTGTPVLDTLLTAKSMYCQQHGINLTCVADGTLLDFLSTGEISTIVGTALDNTTESVLTEQDPEKRLIRVAVYAQNGFVMLRFENYCAQPVELGPDGLPRQSSHGGYDLKSVRAAAETNGGTVTLHWENEWFTLRVLLPQKNEL